MQFDTGTSISLYFPPSGTAGFRTIARQGKEPRAGTAAKHDCYYIFVYRHEF
jgi:hypothetical protein